MKVAIAGYGVEGKISYKYWRDLGHDVTVVDEGDLSPYDLPYSSKAILGRNAFKKLVDFDLVVRTPPLSPTRIKTKGKVWSATNEFFEKCPAPIIGVTGTKGKGTTASLIYSILQASGKTTHLVGNIGTPALGELSKIKADDIVVFELSSFQLWDLERSPHIAVVLMIEPDHLDVHKDMKDYVSAKANIAKWQGKNDTVIYLSSSDGISKQIASLSKGTKVPYLYQTGSYIRDGYFWYDEQKLCSLEYLKLPGGHNAENACAAIAAVHEYVTDGEIIGRGLSTFTGLDHRLKRVREVRGVTYYDDSIATTPGSAIAALRAFSEPKVLILGGKDKGGDYHDLITLCATTNTHVVTIGSNGSKLARLCRKAQVAVTECDSKDMTKIVTVAQGIAKPGSVVILSPAAASFDMFKSYSERGDQFVTAVERLS